MQPTTRKDTTPPLHQDAQAVASYYDRLGSRLGYRLFMKKSQHFGIYDQTHTTEAKAQTKYHEEFAKVLALKPGMRLLDAGCGQGVVSTYLASQCAVQVDGITVVKREVEKAQRLAKRLGVADKTSYRVGDYHQLPYADATFDRVYTTETLSHAYDLSKVVSELYRVLKPGGKLVCAEYEFDYDNPATKLSATEAAEFVRKYAAIHGVFEFGVGNFVKVLKGTGFQEVHEYDWSERVRVSFERLKKIAAPYKGVVQKLGKAERHPNIIAASFFSDAYNTGVFWYKIYVAKKPGGKI